MKKYIFLLLFLVEVIFCFGQNAALNHSKYWFYKYRLRNEFMAVGNDQLTLCGVPLGMNIPATSAYESDGDIHFGDGTSFLGNYMAVLATEYQLLKNTNSLYPIDKENILKELYWCLKTYERLDLQAEKLYPPHMGNCGTGDLNGFFSRDDVDTTIIQRLGNSKSVDPKTLQSRNKIINTSYYKDCHNAPLVNLDNDPGNNVSFTNDDGQTDSDYKDPFPSADQISNLLIGFAFVKKIMSDESYNGENLGDLASSYTTLIMNYFSSINATDIHLPGAKWDIVMPYLNMGLKHGGIEFTIMGYPLAKAGEVITTGKWGDAGPLYFGGQWTGTAAQVSMDAWNCSNYPKGLLMYNQRYNGGNVFTNAILSQLAAIGNSWEYGLIPVKEKLYCVNIPCIKWDLNCQIQKKVCLPLAGCTNFKVCFPVISQWNCGQNYCAYGWHYDLQKPTCMEGLISTSMATILGPLSKIGNVPFPLPKISQNTTGLALSEFGSKTHTEIFSLEHRYLHGGRQWYGTNAINKYMNTAPCSGPHYQPKFDPHNPETSEGHPEWRIENRFEKSNPTGYTNKGGWNGIDYMLLHNLYYLQHANAEDMNGYVNEMNRTLVDMNLNTSRVYNGFETLTASNTKVLSGANIILHAGKCVKMNSGFKAANGSNFKAYTKYTFPCDEVTGYKDVVQQAPSNLPVTDPLRDTTKATNEIIAGIQKTKDSLSPVVQQIQQKQPYQPLGEFLQTPVQTPPPTMPSKILSVFPNPIPIGYPTGVRIYLAVAGSVTLVLKNSMGVNYHSPISFNNLPQGENLLKINLSMPYSSTLGYNILFLQGNNFTSSYNVQIQN